MANTFTNFYPTLFSDMAYLEFSKVAIAPQVVNTTWINPGGPSEAVRIPKFGIGDGIDDVANLVDAPDNQTEASLLLSLDKNRGFHYQVRYNEEEKSNVALGQAILTQKAAALASDVDAKVFAVVSGASTTLSGASVTKAMLVSAIELLNENNAPQTDRVLVVSPDVYSDILNINDFVRADSIAGADANRTGQVGQVLGLTVWLSNNLPGAAVADAIVMHRAAIGMAMLTRIETKIFDQPRHFAVGYTGRAIWGAVLVDAKLAIPLDRT